MRGFHVLQNAAVTTPIKLSFTTTPYSSRKFELIRIGLLECLFFFSHSFNYSFEHSLSFAVRKVVHVVIIWSSANQPKNK